MNTKRILLLVAGGVLVWLLVAGMFALASPDSSYVRNVTTGQTNIVYSTEADSDRAEQLSAWFQLTQGLVLLAVAGLAVHGTRPGRWLRVEDRSTTTPSPDARGGG